MCWSQSHCRCGKSHSQNGQWLYWHKTRQTVKCCTLIYVHYPKKCELTAISKGHPRLLIGSANCEFDTVSGFCLRFCTDECRTIYSKWLSDEIVLFGLSIPWGTINGSCYCKTIKYYSGCSSGCHTEIWRPGSALVFLLRYKLLLTLRVSHASYCLVS